MSSFGLIGAGPVNQYLVGRLPRLSRELGPVAAANHRLASRIVNTLGAGEAKPDLNGLAEAHDILVCAPGRHFELIRPVIESANLNWKRKTVILCACDAFSVDLAALRERGAAVGSLRPVAGLGTRYVVEGDRPAVKVARTVVRDLGALPIEIDHEKTDLFSAALTLSTSLTTPLMEGCMTAIQGAGITGASRGQLLEALFLQTLRFYLYSGRKSWTGTIAEGDEARMEREIAALERIQPAVANVYRAGLESAQTLLRPKR